MNKVRQQGLARKGWKTGSTHEFLELTAEEAAYVELKVLLSRKLREQRVGRQLNQTQLAQLIDSSQSRVAKMEAGDPSVSIDLLVKSLLALGMSRKELGEWIRH